MACPPASSPSVKSGTAIISVGSMACLPASSPSVRSGTAIISVGSMASPIAIGEAIDPTEMIAVPDFTEGELAGESFLGGVQQNQNPFTEVEAEREDFSMWSFLRAAGLVCGCWGR